MELQRFAFFLPFRYSKFAMLCVKMLDYRFTNKNSSCNNFFQLRCCNRNVLSLTHFLSLSLSFLHFADRAPQYNLSNWPTSISSPVPYSSTYIPKSFNSALNNTLKKKKNNEFKYPANNTSLGRELVALELKYYVIMTVVRWNVKQYALVRNLSTFRRNLLPPSSSRSTFRVGETMQCIKKGRSCGEGEAQKVAVGKGRCKVEFWTSRCRCSTGQWWDTLLGGGLKNQWRFRVSQRSLWTFKSSGMLRRAD
jgi:hypothetical protein